MQLRIEGETDVLTLITGHGRTGPVGGQFQPVGNTGQLLPPVFDLGRNQAVRVALVPEDLPLPQGVVGVLHRQGLPLRGLTRTPRRVRHRQVKGERIRRPAVADDVVGQQEQYVLVRRGPEEPRPHGQLVHEVEGMAPGLGHLLRHLLAVGDDDLDHRPGGRTLQDLLVGRALHFGEDGAQGFVPVGEVADGLVQCGGVECAGETEHHRHVVRRAGAFELVEEPEAALGVGEGDVVGPQSRFECGACSGCVVEAGGEAGDGGCFEEVADGEFDAEGGADAAEESYGGEGVSAEVEEVVVDVEGGQVEGVGEEAAEDLFLGGGGAASCGDALLLGGVVGVLGEEFELSVGCPACGGAGGVHQRARVGGVEGVGDAGVLADVVAGEGGAGQVGSGEVQLAGDSGGYGLVVVVQDVDADVVRQGCAVRQFAYGRGPGVQQCGALGCGEDVQVGDRL